MQLLNRAAELSRTLRVFEDGKPVETQLRRISENLREMIDYQRVKR